MTSQIRAEGASGEAEATRDADAFVTLATAQAQQSYRLAGIILRDSVEAQDAIQEALLRAWQAWPKLRESERFDSWFSQIVVNVCRNRLRRRPPVRWMPLGDDLDGPTVADPFQAALARDELGKLVAGLSRDRKSRVGRGLPDAPLGTFVPSELTQPGPITRVSCRGRELRQPAARPVQRDIRATSGSTASMAETGTTSALASGACRA
jgi:hypothetical protein